MWWLSVNFLQTLTPTRSIPSLLYPSAAPPPEPPAPPTSDPAPPPNLLPDPVLPRPLVSSFSQIRSSRARRRSSSSDISRMDGTVQTPSCAEPRVAAHSSVNGNGAARHLHDEWLEEYEAGVFMKLKDLGDGTRELMRVRFSKRRFGEHQAENWWKENHEKVYERYNVRTSQRASSAASTHSA